MNKWIRKCIKRLKTDFFSIIPENYDSLDQAVDEIGYIAGDQASRDCKGIDRCGKKSYSRICKVKHVLVKVKVEFIYEYYDDGYGKKYYYINRYTATEELNNDFRRWYHRFDF